MFLGLIDLSFNVQQKRFTKNKTEGIVNLSIVIIVFFMGILSLIFAWFEMYNLNYIL